MNRGAFKIGLILFLLFIYSCNESYKPMNQEMQLKFASFKKKSKFNKDTSQFFPGLSNESLKPVVETLMNYAADDFYAVAVNNPTEEKYLQAIKTGLHRFDGIYIQLDTEDRERVCHCFEELMDIVYLESSNGQLNDWVYGFNPKK